MNIWLRLQQTLYTKCISESVFGLLCLLFLFLAVEFLLCRDPCLMLILLFPGKLLSSGQSRTQSVKIPPLSHLGGAWISHSASSGRLLPELGERRPADAAVARREGAPPRVCHRETSRSVGVRRCSAGLSAPLKSKH